MGYIPSFDAQPFLIGNIAPDSGFPNEDWTQFEPSKAITHYDNGQPGYRMGDAQFFRAYLASLDEKEGARRSFLWGYFFHLVTDNFWLYEIWRPAKAYLNTPPTPDDITEVKRDWYGQDFIYIRDHRTDRFWEDFLTAQYEPAWFDLVPAAGIEHSLNYIRTFYARTDEKVQALYTHDYQYLTGKQADDFVDSAAERLFRLYQKLAYGEPLPDVHSTLDYFKSLATSD